ncbi:class I SAM-dependent methyltransferase [Ekhidna sp. To15]|uniref:class I SAM-dependent methyltransferase n=1 Tax=Ekhidna sp. To15 TaxID=3395267 RepID=UPI003F520D38
MIADFDRAASTYDKDFTYSLIGTLQRRRVWRLLDKVLDEANGLKILEINCGTGEDASRFAQKGNTVVATDISKEMLNVARKKEKDSDITFMRLDLNDIDHAQLDTDFDLVFSNFGGINCIDQSAVGELSKALLHALKPDGKFVAVIMPKVCLSESFYFIMKGKPLNAFRRNKGFAEVNVSGKQVRTWYYNPKKLSQLLGAGFEKKALKPIGLFVSPSYLESFFERNERLLKLLYFFERVFANFSWQARFSDHYYIQFNLK